MTILKESKLVVKKEVINLLVGITLTERKKKELFSFFTAIDLSASLEELYLVNKKLILWVQDELKSREQVVKH